MKRCFGCFNLFDDFADICPYCGYSPADDAQKPWILPPGTLLNGKYEIGKCLGEGGFGITYLAWDRNMETKIAIKEYFPANAVSRDINTPNGNLVTKNVTYGVQNFEEGLKRYVKEASILSKFFDLPGIVSVKDFFYENNTAYYVMEYIEGMSLRDYIEARGGSIPYEEALALVQPVIRSLHIIHQNNLLHRDISPDNIMISNDGDIKLIDFGAARSMEQAQDNGMTVVLKHGYAPIEQYSRNGSQGPYTDVYGVCAVLYRMITGQVPVAATDRASGVEANRDLLISVKDIRKNAPKHICLAIEKGLSIQPEQRQQNMQELYSELYISKKGVHEKNVNSAYSAAVKALAVIAGILVFVLILVILYRVNYDRFENVRNGMAVMSGENESVSYQDTDDNEYFENQSQTESTATDGISESMGNDGNTEVQPDAAQGASDSVAATVTDTPDVNDTLQEQTLPVQSVDQTAISVSPHDDEIDMAIEAVQKGVLDSGNVPVGDLLDAYSDTPGSWEGYRDNNGDMYVKYSGYKDGRSFAFIFEITSNRTSNNQVYIGFRVAGALLDGTRVDDYNSFFREVIEN